MSDEALYARDPALLRRINAAATLREMHGSGRLTLTQLVQRTGLSRRTAEAVLEDLVRDGLVEDKAPGVESRGVGRPARTFRFRTEAGYAMGIDVDTQRVQAMITDLAGSPVAKVEVGVKGSSSRGDRLQGIERAARQALTQGRIAKRRLQAVTVGTPGLVLPGGEVTVCQVLKDWSDFSLRDELSGFFPCPVIVENDVNLSAIGERWRGVSPNIDNTVWVQTGRRARVAILIGGQLYRGADGAAGEVGWLADLGWAEVRDHPLSSSGSGRCHVNGSFRRTLQAAAAGGPEAVALFDSYGKALSHGLAAVVLALNPTCLVLGGGAALAGEVLVDAVRRHLGPMCLKLPDIRTSQLGEDAVVVGAIRTSLDQIEASLFSVA